MEESEYYKYCLRHNKPYFGTFMINGSTRRTSGIPGPIRRYIYMLRIGALICNERKNSFLKVLEIGSWAGASAITWAEVVRRFNKGNGIVICVDIWEDHAVYDLFLHNVKTTGNENIILPFRGSSFDVLPLLREEMADIIYIDGAHDYDSVRTDIINSIKLVKSGGIICGDDLELQISQVDLEFAEKNKQLKYDVVVDPKAKTGYHPGVTLAVNEIFGAVSVQEGFWAVRCFAESCVKANDKRKKIYLQNLPAEDGFIPSSNDFIPEHLREYFENT